MTRNRNRCWISVLLLFGAVLWPSFGFTDPNQPGGGGFIPHTDSFRTYSCGGGSRFTSFTISSAGNVLTITSPAGVTHNWDDHSGYQVCYTVAGVGELRAYDLGFHGETNFGAPAVLSGCVGSTFPCEITRVTSDGRVRVTRRFTGNSFVGPVPAGNTTYDSVNANGQGCDVLGECGNCTNRTLHVVTRVHNLTGSTLGDVDVIDMTSWAMDGTVDGDIADRTADSVTARETNGLLLQALIPNASTETAITANETSLVGGVACSGPISIATPTAAGNFEGVLFQHFGDLGAGANTGNNIRTHYRRY